MVSAYFPGLNGPLVFDDQLNITENPGVAIDDLSFDSLKKALLSNESGRLKRVLPALSFGINHYIAGGFADTFPFKVTNLFVHCLNTALVAWLVFLLWPRLVVAGAQAGRVNGAVYAALFAAALWALHPLQLTSVLYVVQRMTSMAATFMLLGLCLFVLGRLRLEAGQGKAFGLMSAGVVAGTLLGLTCKENAVLLPLYAGVIEYTLFRRDSLSKSERRGVVLFFGVTLALPFVLGLIYFFVYPGGLLGGYGGRPFTAAERLLTEARVLWFYLHMLAVPDIAVMGLFHDGFALSRGWLEPPTTLLAVVTWLAMVVLAFLLRRSLPVVSFAVFWFLGGHTLESSIIPLQIIHEHRNYLPSLGPVLALAVLVVRALHIVKWQWFRVPTVLAMVFGLYWATLHRADSWRDEATLIETLAENHPLSPSSQYLMGEVLQKRYNAPAEAYAYYFRAAQLEPDEAGFLISLNMATPVDVREKFELDRLSSLVDPAHIEQLLRSGPVSAWGMRALDVASKCVVARHPPCRAHLNDVRRWLGAAVENPRKAGKHRRHFFMRKFEIEMKYGLYAEAMETVRRAQAGDGDFALYDLMLADALGSLGHYPEARAWVDRFERRAGEGSSRYRKQLEEMRRALDVLEASSYGAAVVAP